MNSLLNKINGFKSSLNGSTDKGSQEYILNPDLHPENSIDSHEQDLKIKEIELQKKQELLEIEKRFLFLLPQRLLFLNLKNSFNNNYF